MSCHYSSCVVKNGLLFGFHGRQEAGADLRCVDFKTGRVHWSEPGLRSALSCAGDDLLVLPTRRADRAAAVANEFQIKQRAHITRGEVRAYPALARAFISVTGKPCVAYSSTSCDFGLRATVTKVSSPFA